MPVLSEKEYKERQWAVVLRQLREQQARRRTSVRPACTEHMRDYRFARVQR